MSKGLRITLHIFQIVFLLFGLLCFALICVELFGYDGNYTWAPDDEFMMTVTPTSVLLAIAFSPGLWHAAAKHGVAPQPVGPPPGMPPQAGPGPQFGGPMNDGPPPQAGPPQGQVYGQSPYPPQR